jgi:hypothetical protein
VASNEEDLPMKSRITTFALLAVLALGVGAPTAHSAAQRDGERMAQGMITVLRDTALAVQVDGTSETVFRIEPGITERVGRVAVGATVNVYYHRNEKGQKLVTRIEALANEG